MEAKGEGSEKADKRARALGPRWYADKRVLGEPGTKRTHVGRKGLGTTCE